MKRLLIVEDDLQLQEGIYEALKGQYDLLRAMSLSEAKSLMANNSVDLVLLDIGLPDGDGFHLCAYLKQLPGKADTPVIFLTGSSNLEDKVMAFSLGADAFVSKPFDWQELKARISAKIGSPGAAK